MKQAAKDILWAFFQVPAIYRRLRSLPRPVGRWKALWQAVDTASPI
jgi:hypothetical protein